MWWGDRFHSWGIVLMGGGSSLSSKSTLVEPARAAIDAAARLAGAGRGNEAQAAARSISTSMTLRSDAT
jgi:hypothetical protein